MVTRLEVQLRTPAGSLRLRSGELLQVCLAVRGASQEEILAELWSAVNDRLGHKEHGVPLQYTETQEGWHLFAAAIPAQHTGHFALQFRARVHTQQFWEWAETAGTRCTTALWVDPAWVYDAIVYNAFVRYFGATQQGDAITPGTFEDIRKEMHKLKDMGVNVLYLNPVYMIGELYKNYNPHDLLPDYLQPGCPYSIKDYKSIDPELSFGKDISSVEHPFSEFKRFVETAHSMGIRVFMDLVFNHAAHDAVFQRIHPEWFLYKEHITSLEEPYIYPEEIKNGRPWGDPKHTFAPYDHGWWWQDTAQLNWNNILEYPDFIMPQIAPNVPPQNPTINDMHSYFRNIVKFWIREFGIDGFRCDVAYRVPLSFWKSCITEARIVAKEAHPHNGSIDGDVVFIAEDYHVAMHDLLEAGFTACYGDYSNKLGTLPEITGYLDYMYNISGQHFPQNSLWFIFPECHDFHRNAERLAKHLRDEHKDADLNANKSRWTMTACLPGIPMIFNGFEKMEWQPVSLFSYSTVDWESDKDISEHIGAVNAIRRGEIALQRGTYHYIHTSEGITPQARIFSFARIHEQEVIIVVVNLDVVNKAEGVTLYLPDALPMRCDKYVLHDLLNGQEYERSGKEFSVILEAGEAHIFKVRSA